jgi:uncharacterized protein YheU (UPF0270 family)
MTRDQKEQYVIQLYTEGKTFKEIAKLTHKSIRDISAIIKRHQEKIERESGQLEQRNGDNYDIKSKSKTTQAIKLFSEGKNQVEVVIALDLPADEVRAIYREFLELNNMHKLVEVYDEMQNYLPSLLELFRLIVHQGLDKSDIITVAKTIVSGQLEYMRRRIQSKIDAENWLDDQIRKKEYHLRTLNNKIREFSYREGSIIPMTNNSMDELTYRINNLYPPPLPDDTTTRHL